MYKVTLRRVCELYLRLENQEVLHICVCDRVRACACGCQDAWACARTCTRVALLIQQAMRMRHIVT